MVTITRHVLINIFQTEHFSAMKYDVGCEKNMSILVIPKSLKFWKKKSDLIIIVSWMNLTTTEPFPWPCTSSAIDLKQTM